MLKDDVNNTQRLARFIADLSVGDIPPAVMANVQNLFLDWAGSALVGWPMNPVPLFEDFAQAMAPTSGACEILGGRRRTTAWAAAFVNGASSHVAEQDDVHNGSVFHPATVVFPAVLAAAQEEGASGEELLVAAIAGYEAGIRIGQYLGQAHYSYFHTTGTAGTIAAAIAVGKLLGLDREGLVNAIGSAGTQAAGLWEFLSDAADSKQLHSAKAAADGLLAAYMTKAGLTGARNILEGPQGMGIAMSGTVEPLWLVDRLGERWAIMEMSIKHYASCRHTHPAADALLSLINRESLEFEDIADIEVGVHGAAIDVLGRVDIPRSVHQAKFSMGTVLGLIAVHGAAGLEEFENYALSDTSVERVRNATRMILNDEVDGAYPDRWLGRVAVTMADGRVLRAAIDEPKGDPGNPLTDEELRKKFKMLAARGDWSSAQAERLLERIDGLRSAATVELIS